MFLTALLASGSTPSPCSATTDPTTATLQDAQREAQPTPPAGSSKNWSTWLAIGLRVLLILVIADSSGGAAGDHQADRSHDPHGPGGRRHGLGGLLVNVERRQRSQAIGSVLRSVASFLIIAALMILGTFQIDLAPLLASPIADGDRFRRPQPGHGLPLRRLRGSPRTSTASATRSTRGSASRRGHQGGPARDEAARRQRRDLVRPQRRGRTHRQPLQACRLAGVDVTVRWREDLDKVKRRLDEVAEAMTKEEPWNERLWGPIEVLGLDSVLLDSMVVGLGEDHARQVPLRRTRTPLARQARLRHSGHPRGGSQVPPEEEPVMTYRRVLGNPACPSRRRPPPSRPPPRPATSSAPK